MYRLTGIRAMLLSPLAVAALLSPAARTPTDPRPLTGAVAYCVHRAAGPRTAPALSARCGTVQRYRWSPTDRRWLPVV